MRIVIRHRRKVGTQDGVSESNHHRTAHSAPEPMSRSTPFISETDVIRLVDEDGPASAASP